MIGGNVIAEIQEKKTTPQNEIGEKRRDWETIHTIEGFIDMMSGEAASRNYNAKVQESTHIFIADYQKISSTSTETRMVIDDDIYEIKHIDDPMGLHQHLEIYLSYTGGGVDVS